MMTVNKKTCRLSVQVGAKLLLQRPEKAQERDDHTIETAGSQYTPLHSPVCAHDFQHRRHVHLRYIIARSAVMQVEPSTRPLAFAQRFEPPRRCLHQRRRSCQSPGPWPVPWLEQPGPWPR